MMFGGIFSSRGSMAGMSWMYTNGGLAHANQWPPLMLPLATYREKKADTIPEKWKNLAKYARKRRTRKKWQNKIRREIRKQQRGGKRDGRHSNNQLGSTGRVARKGERSRKSKETKREIHKAADELL